MHLVVVQNFLDYIKGQVISVADEVESVLSTGHLLHVVQVDGDHPSVTQADNLQVAVANNTPAPTPTVDMAGGEAPVEESPAASSQASE